MYICDTLSSHMMSTRVQKSRPKCCVYFGAEKRSEIRSRYFVAPWDLITPPGVMHYHFATRSRILYAGQALTPRPGPSLGINDELVECVTPRLALSCDVRSSLSSS